jgi:hypothetical protein
MTRRWRLGVLGVAIVAAWTCGCQQSGSTVEFTSYKDPYFPQPYVVDFDACAYRHDAGDDCHIVAETTSTEDDQTVNQYLHVQIYWMPQPGKTYAHSTTTNALLRYVVATADGVAEYAGTGFVFPERRRDGRLELAIESGYLRLELLDGDVPELLGDARVEGELIAENDAGTVARVIRKSQLLRGRYSSSAAMRRSNSAFSGGSARISSTRAPIAEK